MDRYCCFRFDVDTHRCIRKGVPNLLELSAHIGVRFTFFVNMGRAVAPTLALRRLIGKGNRESDTAAKLPARVKLGPWDSFVAAFVNPPVGAGSPGILEEAVAGNHEIGLHGGANHALWQADAPGWPARRIREEIGDAVGRLKAVIGHEPSGFASPGWSSPPSLPAILEDLGFRYVADAHGPRHPAVSSAPGSRDLLSVRTNICGEPGGVAYLEHLRARGFDDRAIREDFRDRLRAAGRLAVVYDHPYYAGIRELALVENLVSIAEEVGFQVVRLEDAVSVLARGVT